jgi:Flp pilus assembly pilin Flp
MFKTIKTNGQSIVEYALIVATVTAAFVAMAILIQRSIRSNVKVLDEQVEVKQRQ